MIFIRQLYKKIVIIIFKLYFGQINIKNFKNHKKTFQINKNFSYDFYKIKNCRVFTNTNDVAYIKNNKILNGPSLQIRNKLKNSKTENNAVVKNGTPKIYKYYDKRVFSLLSGIDANYNYFHWFFDSLPRFFLYKRFFKIKKNDHFLVHNYKSDFQKESLKILGINNVINAYDLKHIKAKEVIVVNFSRNKQDPPKWLIKDLRFFYEKNKLTKKENPVKIFIDRANNSSKLRDIFNKKEILTFLKSKKFKIVDPSKLKFLDEIKLFKRASFIIGMYGAGLTNLIFCNSKCKVIQLKNYNVDKMYENIAKKIGLKFYSIKGKNIKNQINDRNFDGLINIELRKLSFLLKKI